VVLFHMNGCPHCIEILEPTPENSVPIWTQIKQRINSEMFGKQNGKKLKIEVKQFEKDDPNKEIELTKLYGKKVKAELLESLNSRGFPTLYIIENGKIHLFDGKILVDPVLNFVREIMKKHGTMKKGVSHHMTQTKKGGKLAMKMGKTMKQKRTTKRTMRRKNATTKRIMKRKNVNDRKVVLCLTNK
jgi:hypothetical protein